MVWLRRDRCRHEKVMVQELIDSGFDAIEVAAAAIKLARAEEKQRPIAPVSEVRLRDRASRCPGSERRPARQENHGRRRNGRSREKGMVSLSLNAGKEHGVRPQDVVGTIAYHADIPGRVLGAIRIHEQHTLVDVPEQFVEQVLARGDHYQIHRKNIAVSTLG